MFFPKNSVAQLEHLHSTTSLAQKEVCYDRSLPGSEIEVASGRIYQFMPIDTLCQFIAHVLFLYCWVHGEQSTCTQPVGPVDMLGRRGGCPGELNPILVPERRAAGTSASVSAAGVGREGLAARGLRKGAPMSPVAELVKADMPASLAWVRSLPTPTRKGA
jgi:hypothetical protein